MAKNRRRALARLLRGEEGFTLTELIVVSILMLVVLGGIYNVFGTGQSYYNTIEGQNIAVQGSSRSMYQITRELRQAVDIDSSLPGYGAVMPGAYQVALRSDLDDDGQFETVAFRVDDSLRLVRYVNEPNTTTYSTLVLATHVRNRADGIPLFTYLDSNRNPITDPTQVAAKAYSIRVEVVVDKDTAYSPLPLRLVSSVTRRNSPSG